MIDLHCHSTASDGTCTPEELAGMAHDFTAFALTDHDTCDGVARFLAAAADQRALRLAGVELSVAAPEGCDTFHMLGLGIDPDEPSLVRFLSHIRDEREVRNEKMLARFQALGLPLVREEVAKFAGGDMVARPHFAMALVAKGVVADKLEAFDRFLGHGKSAYVPRYRPSPEEAMERIHAAGGVAVMAHPRFFTGDTRRLRAELSRYAALGLDGVEAVYSSDTPGETVEHLRIARELGLAVTAGSDFHGKAKDAIVAPGMTVDDDSAFLAPFVAALEKRRRAVAQARRI